MEIIKLTKKKLDNYEVTLSTGETFRTYEDIILKYHLFEGKEIEANTYLEVLGETKDSKAYYQAIKYIGIRLRSEFELKKYLIKKEYNKEVIENTIELLKQQGYINDEVFAKAYLNDKLNLTIDGPLKILRGLNEHQIDKTISMLLIGNIDPNIFIEKVKKIINKRVKNNTKYSKNMLQKKLINDLYNKGYETNLYQYLINDIDLDNTRALKKDYDILVHKHHNLDSFNQKQTIKNKLLKKGYPLSDINQIIN